MTQSRPVADPHKVSGTAGSGRQANPRRALGPEEGNGAESSAVDLQTCAGRFCLAQAMASIGIDPAGGQKRAERAGSAGHRSLTVSGIVQEPFWPRRPASQREVSGILTTPGGPPERVAVGAGGPATLEVELVDVVLAVDEGRAQEDLAAVDDLEIAEAAGGDALVARLELAVDDSAHDLDRGVAEVDRVP